MAGASETGSVRAVCGAVGVYPLSEAVFKRPLEGSHTVPRQVRSYNGLEAN